MAEWSVCDRCFDRERAGSAPRLAHDLAMPSHSWSAPKLFGQTHLAQSLVARRKGILRAYGGGPHEQGRLDGGVFNLQSLASSA